MTSPSRHSASSDRGWGVHWLAAACVQAQISPGTWWTGPRQQPVPCRDGRRQVAAASVEQQDRRHRLHRPRPSVQLPRCLAISASTLVGPNGEREAAGGAAAAVPQGGAQHQAEKQSLLFAEGRATRKCRSGIEHAAPLNLILGTRADSETGRRPAPMDRQRADEAGFLLTPGGCCPPAQTFLP